jgi:SpoVK/Ycf46/Vps4 family AAA+-type ATPase
MEVIDALRKGQNIQAANRKNLSVTDFFDTLDILFKQLADNEIIFDYFFEEVYDLLENNEHIMLAKKIMQYQRTRDHFIVIDLVALLRFCNLYVEDADDHISLEKVEKCFEYNEYRFLKKKLVNKDDMLFDLEWIESTNDGGFEEHETFKLTDKAKEELLSDLNLQAKKGFRKKDILEHESIVVKPLYYNEKVQKQITQLTDLLREENFANVQKRLKDSGMRTGFPCLFYGAPGTGKTETVYQIARQTGRNIFLVDISNTKSMWFGESEKKIKEIFERYKLHVKAAEVTPILLFNEADAVISKRKDIVSGTVAQTENAIQNIILQEMETLNGIMIATTNLTQNLDKAFERRFLYKIEFEKPDNEASQQIWKSIIPTLQDSEAAELSRRFDFSGGQIENISRKCTVDIIISGEETNLDRLIFHCQNELLANDRRPIGFHVN